MLYIFCSQKKALERIPEVERQRPLHHHCSALPEQFLKLMGFVTKV